MKNLSNDHKPEKAMRMKTQPSPNFKLIVNQFNNSSQEENNIDPEKDYAVHCKYFGTEELQNMKMFNKIKSLSLFEKRMLPQ